MTIQDTKTGKILFYALSYMFPCGVTRNEKYRSKQGFKRRVLTLRRYEKLGMISNLVV